MKKWILIAVAVVLTVMVVGEVNAAKGAADNAAVVTVTGKNYCLECNLRKANNVEKCSPDACTTALKVTEAKDADGNGLNRLTGQTLHYLKSDKSAPLTKDIKNYGKTFTIKGTVYFAERALDVASAEITVAKKDDAKEDKGDDDFGDFDDFDFSAGGNKASAKR